MTPSKTNQTSIRELAKKWDAGYAELELPADCESYGEKRAQELAAINEYRASIGLPPFVNDEVENPELAEKRKAAIARYEKEQADKRTSRRITRDRGATRGRRAS